MPFPANQRRVATDAKPPRCAPDRRWKEADRGAWRRRGGVGGGRGWADAAAARGPRGGGEVVTPTAAAAGAAWHRAACRPPAGLGAAPAVAARPAWVRAEPARAHFIHFGPGPCGGCRAHRAARGS